MRQRHARAFWEGSRDEKTDRETVNVRAAGAARTHQPGHDARCHRRPREEIDERTGQDARKGKSASLCVFRARMRCLDSFWWCDIKERKRKATKQAKIDKVSS